MQDIGIVIVNWNTSERLRRCLETVFASQGDFSFSVLVVDNASTDNSVAMVRRHFPDAHVIANDENMGYPRANNVGLRHLGFRDRGAALAHAPRYALLLNPDTELPADALYRMLQFMDSRLDVGAAGPQADPA